MAGHLHLCIFLPHCHVFDLTGPLSLPRVFFPAHSFCTSYLYPFPPPWLPSYLRSAFLSLSGSRVLCRFLSHVAFLDSPAYGIWSHLVSLGMRGSKLRKERRGRGGARGREAGPAKGAESKGQSQRKRGGSRGSGLGERALHDHVFLGRPGVLFYLWPRLAYNSQSCSCLSFWSDGMTGV